MCTSVIIRKKQESFELAAADFFCICSIVEYLCIMRTDESVG